jgi:selenocysteine-specific elongation factor
VGDGNAPPLCLGTAGHVDHGKTWLVRALTGKDTDRLPEERARGISIDLGYAPLVLPGGRRVSVVDVPGHERFVRTMVAGATGIDLFLLVIDAAEGARRQTYEHLAILRLLGIDRGVVAVTKADSVDADTLELALRKARGLVPGAPAVGVSARTGEGLDELHSALGATAGHVERDRALPRATRLFVDRVFTLRGIGTVATGTLWSGSIAVGDKLSAEPTGVDVRARSVQVHDRAVQRAEAGQRVAVGIPGVESRTIRRGDALVEPGAFPTSYRLDIVLEEVEPIPQGQRVHVHHGTAEIPARVVRVGERFAQLRLDAPAVAARGDRVVLRTQTTIGGGRVLDPAPPRHADLARFELLEQGDFAATVHAPVRLSALRHLADEVPSEGLERAGDWVFSRAWLEELRADLHRRIAGSGALDPGIEPPAEPWASAVLPLLGLERRGAKLYLPGSTLSLGDRAGEAARIEEALAEAGPAGLRIEDRQLAAYLERAGKIVRLGDGFAVAAAAYDDARRVLVEDAEREGSITLRRFRDLLGTSRRPAQLLLERFDVDGITRRIGDERVLRRAARGSARGAALGVAGSARDPSETTGRHAPREPRRLQR